MSQHKSGGAMETTGMADLKLAAVHDVAHVAGSQGFHDYTHSYDFIKSAQWSGDGTCVIAASTGGDICTFVIPPDVLEERHEVLRLDPYSLISSHEAVDAIVGYPRFDLQDGATTLILSTINEHPIRLHSAVTSGLVASYPLVNSTTEAFIKPNALIFTQDGSRFIAGSDNLISIFDLSRSGQEPSQSIPTGPKNSKSSWSNPGASMRGIVSALAIDQHHNVLAAGTLTRHVGLYDAGGSGECVGVFTVQGTEADKVIGGQGITQTLWSPCGRYLYIAERKSDGVIMYDIRQTGQLVGWLEGRNARTHQRLHVDVVETNTGHQVWAGGTDGKVRVWINPPTLEGANKEAFVQKLHEDAINSCVMHHSSSVLATASGQRHFVSEYETDGNSTQVDHTIKLWSTQAISPVQHSILE